MASSRARVLPPQQWEQHKRDIVKLYLDKKYTLKVVREKLAKRGFHATEGQFRTRFKLWGIRKPRQGTVSAAPDASTGGQNDNDPPTVDASVAGDYGATAVQAVEDSQRSASTVMDSQPDLDEREQDFPMNAIIVPERLHTVSLQIVQPSSFLTQYEHVGNEARASQDPSYITRNEQVSNEACISQTPSYRTRYGRVDNEAHDPRFPPSFQYSTSGSNIQQQAPPFGLQYETAARYCGYSLGLSLDGDTLADNFWNSTESINQQPGTASMYG